MTPGLIAALIVLAPAEEPPEPCRNFAYETLTLAAPTVYADDQIIEAPAPLAALTQLENSREDGFEALISQSTSARGAVFRIDRAFHAPPAVRAALSNRKRPTIRSCGTTIPFRPLRPGRYAFVHPQDLDGFVATELLVAPGRDAVELRMRDQGRRIRAVYPITCARFDDDPAAGCAPTEASPRDLDALPDSDPGTPSTTTPRRSAERRLQTQVRVSWSLAGVGVGGLIAGAIISPPPGHCCYDGFAYLVVLPFSAALTLSAAIAGAVYTHRLRQRRRIDAGRSARIEPLPGRVGFRF